jgi:hypothetical protein
MARGWESKNIESQQEEATRARTTTRSLTPEEQVRQTHRQGLELARSRAESDLTRATAPAHRSMLEQAIAALDAQLADS